MKKKFINGLLMAAMFIGVTGSMVSCKDYDDSKVYDLQSILADKNANLLQQLGTQKKTLDSLLTAFEAQKNICKTNCQSYTDSVIAAKLANYTATSELLTWLQNNYTPDLLAAGNTALSQYLNNYFTQNVSPNYYDKTYIDNLVATLQTQGDANKADSVLRAKVDSLEDVINDLRSTIPDDAAIAALLADAGSAVQQALSNYITTNIDNLIQQWMDVHDEYTSGGVDSAWVAQYTQQLISDSLTAIYNQLALNEQAISKAQADATEALTLAQANEQKLVDLTQEVLTNAANIATNTANIATNAGNIATNAANIATNAANIQTNADAIEALKTALNTLQQAHEALETQVGKNTTAIAENKTAIENAVKDIEDLTKRVEANETNIATLQTSVSTMQTAISTLQADLQVVRDSVFTVNEKVDGVIGDVATLKSNLQIVRDSVYNLSERLNTVGDSVYQLNAQVVSNTGRIEALEAVDQQILDRLDDLDAADTKLGERIDSLAGVTKSLSDRITADSIFAAQAVERIDQAIDGLNGQITTINETLTQQGKDIAQNATDIATLRTDYETFAQAVNDNLTTLNTDMAKAKEDIIANTKAIESLQGEVTKIKNALAKFITAIEINGTKNPVYGELNTPVGIRSNVLAAFHGTLQSQGLKFPTRTQRYYALPDEYTVITAKDVEMLGGDLTKIEGYLDMAQQNIVAGDGKAGNAGTLYLTVNPSNRDFEGTEFTLINSQNQESSVKLEAIEKTDHIIKAGYTRGSISNDAQSGNGFYAAKATFTKEAVNDDRTHLNLDLAGVKDVVKDVRNFRDGVNIVNIASTIYNNVNDLIELDAVKATWQDEATGKEVSVVSQYDIAAVSIKPLSFSFAKDFNADGGIPALNRIENFVGRVIDRVANQVKVRIPSWESFGFHIEALHLNEFTLQTLDTKSLDGKAEVTVSFDGPVNVNLGTLDMDDIEITVDPRKVWVEGEEVKSYLTNKDGDYVIDLNDNGQDDGAGIDDYIDPELVKHISSDGTAYYSETADPSQRIGKLIQVGVTIVEGKWVEVPGQTITVTDLSIDAGTRTITLKFETTVDLKDQLVELYGDVNKVLENANKNLDKMISDINTYIADVVGQIDNVKNLYESIPGKIDTATGMVKNLVHEYLDKINARIGKYMTPNKYLQPFIVGRVGGSQYFRLNQAEDLPTTISAEQFELNLTTFTAETVCPAYKKFVAVTNVWKNGDKSASAQNGNAASKAALDAANSQDNVKKVIDGGYSDFFGFQAKKGYTYEILYTAVDYAGLVVAEKFYVSVK